MEQSEETIFEAFKRNVEQVLVPYLSDFNFPAEDFIHEGPQWINARFVRDELALVVSLSNYDDDAAKGMAVILHTPGEDLHLRDEVEKNSTGEFPVYFFSTDVIDAEFKRLVRDIKRHFEPLLEQETEEIKETNQPYSPNRDTSPGETEPDKAYEETVPEETPPPVIEEDGIAEEQPAQKPEPPKEVPVVNEKPEKMSWWKRMFGRK